MRHRFLPFPCLRLVRSGTASGGSRILSAKTFPIRPHHCESPHGIAPFGVGGLLRALQFARAESPSAVSERLSARAGSPSAYWKSYCARLRIIMRGRAAARAEK
jgi:hypothetical protein